MNSKRILLIDDDEITNYINTKVLKIAVPDVEITVALNGMEALRKIDDRLAQNHPDFTTIMVDISMPYMDGWAFIESISAKEYDRYHQTNIVMLTSSVFEDDMERVRSSKVVKGFFSKPLDITKVKSILSYEETQQ